MAAKPKSPDRRQLAEELVGIHKEHRKVFERMDAIKASLKQLAGEAGASFQELFSDVGKVSVAPPKPKTFKGRVPECVPEKFYALPKGEQTRLEKQGLIVQADQYTGAYYGSVTVDLY